MQIRLERDGYPPPPSRVPCRFIIIILIYFLSVIVDRRFSNNKNFDGNYIFLWVNTYIYPANCNIISSFFGLSVSQN